MLKDNLQKVLGSPQKSNYVIGTKRECFRLIYSMLP